MKDNRITAKLSPYAHKVLKEAKRLAKETSYSQTIIRLVETGNKK